ncbi:hypothetical protein N7499_007049 [Penicillium canescens]|nr:hypothetical protein N7499_007049 [Penicillium canescens]KAJ6176029.1 hypothetical protein N7485_002943 [Penicillium canescens]
MQVSATFMDLPAPDIHPGVPKNVLEGQIFNHEDVAQGIPPPSLPWERLAPGDATLGEKGTISPELQAVSQQRHFNNENVPLDVQHVDAVATSSPNRTRSGRSVQKPTTHDAEKAAMKQSSKSAKLSTKKRQRTKSQINILCTSCNRGNSPSNNLIVLCDECDTPWHQKCHDPNIGNDVIETLEAEWVCSECKPEQRSAKRQKHTSTRGRKPATKRSPRTTSVPQTPSQPYRSAERQQLVLPATGAMARSKYRVGGEALSEDDRRTYLTSLSHAELVELLVDVSRDFPRFPMFPSNLQPDSQESDQSSQPATAPTPSTKSTKASPKNGARAVSVTVETPATEETSIRTPKGRTLDRRTHATTAFPDTSSDPTFRAASAATTAIRNASYDVYEGGNPIISSRNGLPDRPLFPDEIPESGSLLEVSLFGAPSAPVKNAPASVQTGGAQSTPVPRPSMASDFVDTLASPTAAGNDAGTPFNTMHKAPSKMMMRPPSPVSFSGNDSDNDSVDYRAYADAGEGFNASLAVDDRDIMAEAEDYPTFSHSVRWKK